MYFKKAKKQMIRKKMKSNIKDKTFQMYNAHKIIQV